MQLLTNIDSNEKKHDLFQMKIYVQKLKASHWLHPINQIYVQWIKNIKFSIHICCDQFWKPKIHILWFSISTFQTKICIYYQITKNVNKTNWFFQKLITCSKVLHISNFDASLLFLWQHWMICWKTLNIVLMLQVIVPLRFW